MRLNAKKLAYSVKIVEELNDIKRILFVSSVFRNNIINIKPKKVSLFKKKKKKIYSRIVKRKI